MASKPTKGEIRAFMKRVREDLVGLNKALTANHPHQVQIYVSDMLGCMEEIAGMSEERYGLEIEMAQVGPCSEPEEEEYEDEEDEFEDEEDEEEEACE